MKIPPKNLLRLLKRKVAFVQIVKIPPQNLVKRKTAVVLDLNVFKYLQNSEGSDDLIKNAVYRKISCDG